MDEMFEFLTLIQTHKMGRPRDILLYGSKFWKRAHQLRLAARDGDRQQRGFEIDSICRFSPAGF